MKTKKLTSVATALLLLALSSHCYSQTLTSIAVTPANPSIGNGANQQFTATGTFSDASSRVLTGVDTWASKAPMPTARYAPASAVVNGIIYVIGGNNSSDVSVTTVEAYDPVSNTWTTKGAMPTARRQASAGVVNGIIYVVGGSIDGSAPDLATVEAYDPVSNTWTTKASMPTARYDLAVGVVNGILYAVGGWNGSSRLPTVEAYDPAFNTWTTKASMPTTREGMGIGVVNGILYAVGGDIANGVTTAAVEAYDPAFDTWTTKTSIPTARSGPTVGVVNGILYAVGGTTGGCCGQLATDEAYDPALNTWTTKTSMPTGRYLATAGVVNGIIYFVGGQGDSIALAANEAFTPSYNLTWNSGTPAVATIDSNGLATGVSAGTSLMIATSGAVSGNTTLTVYTLLSSVGTYTGLFYESGIVAHQSSGYFSFTLASSRTFNGSIKIEGGSYPLTGRFTTFSTNVVVARLGKPSLTVSLTISQSGGNASVNGTVSDGSWTAELSGDKAYYSVTNLPPQRGQYSMTILGDSNGDDSPGYGSYGLVTVKSNGFVVLTGKLSDNVSTSEATTLSKDGVWPLYVPLYMGKGSLIGWMTFTNQPTYKLTGNVSWIKTNAFGLYYTNGFTNAATVFGSVRH